MFGAFFARPPAFSPRVLQKILVVPERQDKIPDADADVAHDLQQLRFFLQELADVGGHLIFLVIQQDAEIVPVLAGVALVRRAICRIAFKPAVAFDVSRDVLVAADGLCIPDLQHFLNVLFPIIRIPRLGVTWHIRYWPCQNRAGHKHVTQQTNNQRSYHVFQPKYSQYNRIVGAHSSLNDEIINRILQILA